jgi:RNA polymerase sigma-70 factor (ECF subfamily)
MSRHNGTISGPASRPPGWDGLGPPIAAVARGDPGAFDVVYGRLLGPVYGAILAVLRDPAQAEEVAQEVFLEIWRMAFRYNPDKGSVTRWALTIARHRAVDRVRSAAAASARELRTAADLTPPPDGYARADDFELLRQCLPGLSPLQREAITLAFYDEHTYAEVARLLDVPLGTVKARIRDGLARLRRCMQGGGGTREREAAARRLQDALGRRVLIEQAAGILAQRLQTTPDEAGRLLRRYARDHHRSLAQVADDIARGTPGGPPAAGAEGALRRLP